MNTSTRCFLVLVACAPASLACDLCAIYSASAARGETGAGFFGGVAEQFTHFGTWQQDGAKVHNEPGEFLNSSITQLLGGYNWSDRFGVQVNVPLIHRWFKRAEGAGTATGTETGLGDLATVAHFKIVRTDSENSSIAWNISGGIKLPTGDSRRLREELNEGGPGEEPASGIHGHDLTLGSGSFDGLVGTSAFARWKHLFFSASAQYSVRTEGDIGYQFANDLVWSGGPGTWLVLSDNFSLGLQANVSGETKGRDTFRSSPAEDTGITSIFVGPQISVTWREQLSTEAGVDLPASIDNTALQIVPDYRLRIAVTWRF